MRLFVRTWNVYHGRTVPETRATHLEEAVRLITGGDPDVVCLQEVPAWALARLEAWAGMTAFGAVTMPALGGPLARPLTELDPRLLRSALTGQGNAILLSRRLRVDDQQTLVLNPRSLRRRERLPLRANLAWLRNRRVGQFVRVGGQEGSVVVANLHLTAHSDSRLADRELLRAATYAEDVAEPGEPIVLCGDLNLSPGSSLALRELERWGFSPPVQGIDQILQRDLVLTRGPEAWAEERRRLGDRLLSDHAPLEAEMIGP